MHSGNILFSIRFIEVDLLALLMVGLAVLLFLLSMSTYQMSIKLLYNRLQGLETDQNFEKLENIIQRHDELQEVKLLVIDDEVCDAYSFSIFSLRKFRFIHVVVLTSILIEKMSIDELEVTLFHEWAHTKQYHTRLSCMLLFFKRFGSLIPGLSFLGNLMWESNEIDADSFAISQVNKPIALVCAICKISNLIYPNSAELLQSKILFRLGDQLPKRIRVLVNYAKSNGIMV